MFNFQIKRSAETVNPLKPFQNAGKINHAFPALLQIFFRQANAHFFGCFHKIIHTAGHLVGAVFTRPLVGLGPELVRRHPELRNQAKVLHILSAQGFVKVINQSDFSLIILHF